MRVPRKEFYSKLKNQKGIDELHISHQNRTGYAIIAGVTCKVLFDLFRMPGKGLK